MIEAVVDTTFGSKKSSAQKERERLAEEAMRRYDVTSRTAEDYAKNVMLKKKRFL